MIGREPLDVLCRRMKSTERKIINVIRTVPVLLVVPGVWAPAGVRIIYFDVDTASVSNGFSRTVSYNQLQYALVDVNTSPKLVKNLGGRGDLST